MLPLQLIEWLSNGQYLNTYAIEFDPSVDKYKARLGSQAAAGLDIIYQVEPPVIASSDTGILFPSAMTLAMGAAIYAKQGENPLRADVSQEWDEFHAELDRHVARSEKNKPQQMSKNLQDYYGTYTGDVSRY